MICASRPHTTASCNQKAVDEESVQMAAAVLLPLSGLSMLQISVQIQQFHLSLPKHRTCTCRSSLALVS